MSGEGDRGRLRPVEVLALGVLLPGLLHVVTTLGLVSSYSYQLYNRANFLGQYENSVYRFRVVGREVLLFVDGVLRHFGLVVHTPASDIARGGQPWELFSAFFVANGTALVLFATLVCVVTARSREWALAYVVLLLLVVGSGYVVTPYDYLSYLWIAAAVVLVLTRHPAAWAACIPVAVLGTATRESFLVAVAAAAAVWLAYEPRRLRLLAAVGALAVAAGGTYVALRLALREPGQSYDLWLAPSAEMNRNMGSLIAAAVVVVGLGVLHAVFPRIEGEARARYRRAVALLWLFSTPYLAVSFVGGLWFEALRLVLPIVICQYLLRWDAHRGPAVGNPAPSR